MVTKRAKKPTKRVKDLPAKKLNAGQAKTVKGGYDDGFGPMRKTGKQ